MKILLFIAINSITDRLKRKDKTFIEFEPLENEDVDLTNTEIITLKKSESIVFQS